MLDFPVFEMPWIGNRWLIGLVASTHVLINHSAAIGGSVMVVLAERQALVTGDWRWERLAYRLALIFFVLTTTVGALSGVGIWFTTMVAQPVAIGSLLRVHFWAWFIEWFVFLSELALVMVYFMSWERLTRSQHLKVGYAYIAMSFLTLAIITGILGSMLTPGAAGFGQSSVLLGFFNPSYPAQLILRTGLALGLSAFVCLCLSLKLAPDGLALSAQRLYARWAFYALPFVCLGGGLYLFVLSDHAKSLLPVAMLTARFAHWLQGGVWLLLISLVVWTAFTWLSLKRARIWSISVAVIPVILSAGLLGYFERVREFVRKPYVITGYLYANGIKVSDRATLDRDGVLAHARYVPQYPRGIEGDRLRGQAIYRLECASCHTINGLNGLQAKVKNWDEAAIVGFIGIQERVHPFMPPFVGTEAEKKALARYLRSFNDSLPQEAHTSRGKH